MPMIPTSELVTRTEGVISQYVKDINGSPSGTRFVGYLEFENSKPVVVFDGVAQPVAQPAYKVKRQYNWGMRDILKVTVTPSGEPLITLEKQDNHVLKLASELNQRLKQEFQS